MSHDSICDLVLSITTSNVVWWDKNVKTRLQEVIFEDFTHNFLGSKDFSLNLMYLKNLTFKTPNSELNCSELLSSSQFRIGDISESIRDEVEGKDRGEDGEAREDGEPRCIGKLI